jgi:hypothetical protein
VFQHCQAVGFGIWSASYGQTTKCGHSCDMSSPTQSPDHKPSSNSDLPVAWITGPATDPSLCNSISSLPFSLQHTVEVVQYIWSRGKSFCGEKTNNEPNLRSITFFQVLIPSSSSHLTQYRISIQSDWDPWRVL